MQFVSALDVEESENLVSSALHCLISNRHLEQEIQREKESELQKVSKNQLEKEYESGSESEESAQIDVQPAAQENQQWYSFSRLDSDLDCERAFCTQLSS